MKIIILGAGVVGSAVAHQLTEETNDVTVVDDRPHLLKLLHDRLKIRTVVGHPSHPSILIKAGIEDADLILAVTNSDEINMLACQVAHSLFRTPIRLARIRAPGLMSHPELFAPNAVPIDFVISPEQRITKAITHLIERPGALQVIDFADGKAQMVAVRAYYGGPLVGNPLSTLPVQLPKVKTRVVAVFRKDRAITPNGDTVIEANDEVFFLAEPRDIHHVLTAFRGTDKANKRVIIAGGGNLGKRLAEMIESSFRVKLIERDYGRCRNLAETLNRTIVFNGDAAETSLLIQEDIKDTDIFCAITNDDATNILSAMLAKRLGAYKVLSIINKTAYVNIAQGNAVDIAISPVQVTIGALLEHIRRGDVVAVHSLRRGAAEALEIVAHGDKETSKVVGRRIEELPLPPGTTIGAIARGDTLIFPHHDTVIESEDHVIFFLADKKKVIEVERLFQVAITFL